MRLIIAGTRTFKDAGEVERAVRIALDSWGMSAAAVTEVVSGGSRGVDRLGEAWAARRGIASRVIEARWHLDGRAAGPMRNERMAQRADALIAVWDGASPGTRDMIQRAQSHGLRVYVHSVKASA